MFGNVVLDFDVDVPEYTERKDLNLKKNDVEFDELLKNRFAHILIFLFITKIKHIYLNMIEILIFDIVRIDYFLIH
jgi:hypothetical protein